MLFDKLARIIEANDDDECDAELRANILGLMRCLKRTHLFVFETRPESVLERNPPADEMSFCAENFILPFDSVAVEDAVSCVVLENLEDNQKGLDGGRAFIEIQPLLVPSRPYTPEQMPRVKQMAAHYRVTDLASAYRLVSGRVARDPAGKGDGYCYRAALNGMMVAQGEKTIYAKESHPIDQHPIDAETMNSGAGNAWIAIREMMFLNTPDRHILEIAPTNAPAERADKILRSHQRPMYLILHPTEIRKRMEGKDNEPQEGSPKCPHERRAHFRRLRSARFINKVGQIIPVKRCWIGPSESVVGNRRYRVLIDK